MDLKSVTEQVTTFAKPLCISAGVGYLGAKCVSTTNPFVGSILLAMSGLILTGINALFDPHRPKYENLNDVNVKFISFHLAKTFVSIKTFSVSTYATAKTCQLIGIDVGYESCCLLQKQINSLILKVTLVAFVSVMAFELLGFNKKSATEEFLERISKKTQSHPPKSPS